MIPSKSAQSSSASKNFIKINRANAGKLHNRPRTKSQDLSPSSILVSNIVAKANMNESNPAKKDSFKTSEIKGVINPSLENTKDYKDLSETTDKLLAECEILLTPTKVSNPKPEMINDEIYQCDLNQLPLPLIIEDKVLEKSSPRYNKVPHSSDSQHYESQTSKLPVEIQNISRNLASEIPVSENIQEHAIRYSQGENQPANEVDHDMERSSPTFPTCVEAIQDNLSEADSSVCFDEEKKIFQNVLDDDTSEKKEDENTEIEHELQIKSLTPMKGAAIDIRKSVNNEDRLITPSRASIKSIQSREEDKNESSVFHESAKRSSKASAISFARSISKESDQIYISSKSRIEDDSEVPIFRRSERLAKLKNVQNSSKGNKNNRKSKVLKEDEKDNSSESEKFNKISKECKQGSSSESEQFNEPIKKRNLGSSQRYHRLEKPTVKRSERLAKIKQLKKLKEQEEKISKKRKSGSKDTGHTKKIKHNY